MRWGVDIQVDRRRNGAKQMTNDYTHEQIVDIGFGKIESTR